MLTFSNQEDDACREQRQLCCQVEADYRAKLLALNGDIENVNSEMVNLESRIKNLLPMTSPSFRQSPPPPVPADNLDLKPPITDRLDDLSTESEISAQFRTMVNDYFLEEERRRGMLKARHETLQALQGKLRGLQVRMNVYSGLIANGNKIPDAEEHLAKFRKSPTKALEGSKALGGSSGSMIE